MPIEFSHNDFPNILLIVYKFKMVRGNNTNMRRGKKMRRFTIDIGIKWHDGIGGVDLMQIITISSGFHMFRHKCTYITVTGIVAVLSFYYCNHYH